MEKFSVDDLKPAAVLKRHKALQKVHGELVAKILAGEDQVAILKYVKDNGFEHLETEQLAPQVIIHVSEEKVTPATPPGRVDDGDADPAKS